MTKRLATSAMERILRHKTMSFRGLIGAFIGGSIGFMQFFWLVYLDASNPRNHLPKNDVWFWIFAFTWVLELVALVAIAMYRFAPWVTRLLGDDFETYWILKEKKQQWSLIMLLSSLAIIVRALVRLIDAGTITKSVGLGLAFAIVPFVVPQPGLLKMSPSRHDSESH